MIIHPHSKLPVYQNKLQETDIQQFLLYMFGVTWSGKGSVTEKINMHRPHRAQLLQVHNSRLTVYCQNNKIKNN